MSAFPCVVSRDLAHYLADIDIADARERGIAETEADLVAEYKDDANVVAECMGEAEAAFSDAEWASLVDSLWTDPADFGRRMQLAVLAQIELRAAKHAPAELDRRGDEDYDDHRADHAEAREWGDSW
jgi:hypothetical protein